MPRYFSRAWFDSDHDMEIIQPEARAIEGTGTIDTGLLDQAGNPIFRSDKIQLGFDISMHHSQEIRMGKKKGGGKKC